MTTGNFTTTTPSVLTKQDKIRRLVADFFAGRKESTIRVYRQGLRDFAGFLRAETINHAVWALLLRGPGEANHLALTYRADMIERGLAPNTVNSRLTALRSVVALARRIGMVTWTLEVDGAKGGAYRDTAGPGLQGCRLMLAEVTQRISGPPRQRVKALRDRAILRLLFDLALRRSSIVALDLEDIDLDAGTIRVWSKGADDGQRDTRHLPAQTALAFTGMASRAWKRTGNAVYCPRPQEPGRSAHRRLGPAGGG